MPSDNIVLDTFLAMCPLLPTPVVMIEPVVLAKMVVAALKSRLNPPTEVSEWRICVNPCNAKSSVLIAPEHRGDEVGVFEV